ncbi:hypothetical protein [Streptomyces sp. NPDC051636]
MGGRTGLPAPLPLEVGPLPAALVVRQLLADRLAQLLLIRRPTLL